MWSMLLMMVFVVVVMTVMRGRRWVVWSVLGGRARVADHLDPCLFG